MVSYSTQPEAKCGGEVDTGREESQAKKTTCICRSAAPVQGSAARRATSAEAPLASAGAPLITSAQHIRITKKPKKSKNPKNPKKSENQKNTKKLKNQKIQKYKEDGGT